MYFSKEDFDDKLLKNIFFLWIDYIKKKEKNENTRNS